MDSKEVILWVDILCFSSILKIFSYRDKVDKVKYLNSHRLISPFISIIFKNLLKIPVAQVDDIVESELKIEKVSLYESIQSSIDLSLTAWVDNGSIKKEISAFAITSKQCPKKFREHVKEATYFLIFRPVEMLEISKSLNCSDHSFFLLRSSIVQKLVENIYYQHKVEFYSYNAYVPGVIMSRNSFLYDRYLYQYMSSIRYPIILIIKWISSLVGKVIALFYYQKSVNLNNIGVELIQDKFRINKNNDIFWLNNSGIDSNTVQGISFVNYDIESLSQLVDSGINICMPAEVAIRHPKNLFNNLRSYTIISADLKYFVNTLLPFFKLFVLMFKRRDAYWLSYQKIQYLIRVKYWESIYNNIGVTLLWSMVDIDSEKQIKLQAMENNHGISFGSHWSIFPICTTLNKKSNDVVFSWGEGIINNCFAKSLVIKKHHVGYISDYLFNDNINSEKETGGFVITYFDNMVGNDIGYSKAMQTSIYNILVSLLYKYTNISLYLKPKRYIDILSIAKSIPSLMKFIDIGRVKLFVNNEGERIPPHSIGMNSDLVIGLGISTAAAECCFAGTVSFHADLTGFVNNDFANNALGKAVFRDVSDLELAIERQISGKGISIEECRELHKCLDPYQDGQAYLRVGSVLKQVQQNLGHGMSRKDAIEKVKI